MAKLRHLAIAADDPDITAQFYIDSFDFWRVSAINARWGRGHVITDGTISISTRSAFLLMHRSGSTKAPTVSCSISVGPPSG